MAFYVGTFLGAAAEDPMPTARRDVVTFYAGDNGEGNVVGVVRDTSGGKNGVSGVPRGANSVYVPPGWSVKIYEDSDRDSVLTGDVGKRWTLEGPALLTRPNKSGYGRRYNWAWVRAKDRRTIEQQQRDAQVQSLLTEQVSSAAEATAAAAIAQQTQMAAEQLALAKQAQAEKLALQEDYLTRQSIAAANSAAEAEAQKQASILEQQRRGLVAQQQQAAAYQGSGASKYIIPAALGIGVLIVGLAAFKRRG